MKNRLQFLLRKNARKQYFEIYQEELSKLVIGKDIKASLKVGNHRIILYL